MSDDRLNELLKEKIQALSDAFTGQQLKNMSTEAMQSTFTALAERADRETLIVNGIDPNPYQSGPQPAEDVAANDDDGYTEHGGGLGAAIREDRPRHISANAAVDGEDGPNDGRGTKYGGALGTALGSDAPTPAAGRSR